MSTVNIPPSWRPSPKSVTELRDRLVETDLRLAEMRAFPLSGEVEFDQAWTEVIEAGEAANCRIRWLLDAEDWPTLMAELLDAREARAAGESAESDA
ncbi:hypothetical protein [Glycomyces sp. NPDC047010]|uniref:hypothetical protein n=1 Tax=Glycomyces sp. NPDC047010 TaxID=3155023 RepID=UPI0033F8F0B9